MARGHFDMAFNVVLAVGFIGLLGPLARLLERLFPARKDAADPASPRYLEDTTLETSSLAQADAAGDPCAWVTSSR